jgi:hypothetical protein
MKERDKQRQVKWKMVLPELMAVVMDTEYYDNRNGDRMRLQVSRKK